MKLNIGGGGRPMDGYLSVDLSPGRVDIRTNEVSKPDIMADARDLHMIETDTVEEVMAIHLIEHLEFWEVPKALREWFRVLKPGGKVVIECPDVLKCCINVLQAQTTQHPILIAKGGLWGLYGDPAHEEPLMMHRSGWMPGTLAHELKQAGFVDPKLKTALHHWPDARDMRMEAYKPGDVACA